MHKNTPVGALPSCRGRFTVKGHATPFETSRGLDKDATSSRIVMSGWWTSILCARTQGNKERTCYSRGRFITDTSSISLYCILQSDYGWLLPTTTWGQQRKANALCYKLSFEASFSAVTVDHLLLLPSHRVVRPKYTSCYSDGWLTKFARLSNFSVTDSVKHV